MKTREIYGGNYLTAEDLNGKAVPAVVRDVTLATMNDNKKKAVLHFKNSEKVLALNVTNANMMEELTGSDETDDWIGVRICLYPTKVDFQGKRVLAVRIKAFNGAGPAQAAPQAPQRASAKPAATPARAPEPDPETAPAEALGESEFDDVVPF